MYKETLQAIKIEKIYRGIKIIAIHHWYYTKEAYEKGEATGWQELEFYSQESFESHKRIIEQGEK